MWRTIISTLCIVAGLVPVVSCNRIEENVHSVGVNGKTVINGVAGAVGNGTKAYNAYCYEVLWQKYDEIYVTKTDGTDDMFILEAGENTPKGTFVEKGDKGITGEIEAFYPSTLKTDDGYVWPAVQTNDQVAPMYARQSISGTGAEIVSFSSLGSMIQIVFNTTIPNIVLKSIEIKDGTKPLSGKFTVDPEGKAVISADGATAITLDLGNDGKILGKGANYFYVSVPAGKYEDLTLTFTSDDGGRFVITGGKLDIQLNTVGRLTLTGTKYHPVILPGVFTVRAGEDGVDATKVRFSPGNLRYDVRNGVWGFFLNQYDCGPETYTEGHDKEISLFTWGYGNWSTCPDTDEHLPDVVGGADFSHSQDWGSRLCDGSVWRTLTREETDYLFNDKSRVGRAVVCGVNGHIVLPDTFVDPLTNRGSCSFVSMLQSDIDDTFEDNIYLSESDWDAMESAGAVFIPAAGYREKDTIKFYGEISSFWTSTSSSLSNPLLAHKMHMNTSKGVHTVVWDKNVGIPVRLVTEVTD